MYVLKRHNVRVRLEYNFILVIRVLPIKIVDIGYPLQKESVVGYVHSKFIALGNEKTFKCNARSTAPFNLI